MIQWPPAAFCKSSQFRIIASFLNDFLTITVVSNDGYIGLESADKARAAVDIPQFIRYLDQVENNYAGKGWNGICAKSPV